MKARFGLVAYRIFNDRLPLPLQSLGKRIAPCPSLLHFLKRKKIEFFSENMALHILADVAAATPKTTIANGPVLTVVVPVVLTFTNALLLGDSILITTSYGTQTCKLTSNVPANQPIVVKVHLPSCDQRIKKACHVPRAVLMSYGQEAQKTRVQKYVRKRSLAEKRLSASRVVVN